MKCLFLFLAFFFLACEKKKSVDAPMFAWRNFRGNHGLLGVVAQPFPSQPTIAWRFKAGRAVSSTPVHDHKDVYFGSDDGYLYAIAIASGEKKWSFQGGSSFEASPLLYQGKVFAACLDGKLYCLDAKTGEVLWDFSTDAKISGAVNLLEDRGKAILYFGSHDCFVYAVDAASGKMKWKYESDSYINGTPAVNEDKVIVGGCDDLVHILDRENGKLIERLDCESYIPGSVATEADFVYLGNYANKIMRGNLKGGVIDWHYSSEERGNAFMGSPAIGDDTLVMGGKDYRIHAVDKHTGEKKWTFKTRGEVDASALIYRENEQEKALIGSLDGTLYLLDVVDGRVLWSVEIGEGISSSVSPYPNGFFVGTDDGTLYFFQGT